MHDKQPSSSRAPLLAISGGVPACPAGPPAWPLHDPAIDAVLAQMLADGSWGRYHGRWSEQLTERLQQLFGLQHVLLCCSGTLAVELALRALGLGAGDEVVLAGYDFPGNFRAIEAIGARPVLADIDLATGQLDPAQLEAAIGPQTKAVLVSHLHGGQVPMPAVRQIADRHGLLVVEDLCQAPLARWAGRLLGTWGDAAVLSFGGSKLLSAGRGGAVLLPDATTHQRGKLFCERGNHAFPLSEMQAAVLLPQLERLAERNAQRRAAAVRLEQAWAGQLVVRPLVRPPEVEAVFYKLPLRYLPAADQPPREAFIAALQAEGVALDAGFRGFALRSSRRCRSVGTLDNSRELAASILVLHHPVLLGNDAQLDQVVAAIDKVIDQLVLHSTVP